MLLLAVPGPIRVNVRVRVKVRVRPCLITEIIAFEAVESSLIFQNGSVLGAVGVSP